MARHQPNSSGAGQQRQRLVVGAGSLCRLSDWGIVQWECLDVEHTNSAELLAYPVCSTTFNPPTECGGGPSGGPLPHEAKKRPPFRTISEIWIFVRMGGRVVTLPHAVEAEVEGLGRGW